MVIHNAKKYVLNPIKFASYSGYSSETHITGITDDSMSILRDLRSTLILPLLTIKSINSSPRSSTARIGSDKENTIDFLERFRTLLYRVWECSREQCMVWDLEIQKKNRGLSVCCGLE